ncbi:hypothetical protein QQG55_37870 [Brugia pahangi]
MKLILLLYNGIWSTRMLVPSSPCSSNYSRESGIWTGRVFYRKISFGCVSERPGPVSWTFTHLHYFGLLDAG